MWLQRDFGIYICNMFDTGQVGVLKTLDENIPLMNIIKFRGTKFNNDLNCY